MTHDSLHYINILTYLLTYKSTGPYVIPNWILQDMAPFIAEPIYAIFNASVRQGHVPDLWKQANVAPVPKTKVPKNIHSNLHPIILIPTIAKILESFVGQWMLENIVVNCPLGLTCCLLPLPGVRAAYRGVTLR